MTNMQAEETHIPVGSVAMPAFRAREIDACSMEALAINWHTFIKCKES